MSDDWIWNILRYPALDFAAMLDIIQFRDCTLLSFYHSLIVVLDRTVPDFYIASLRCRTSNSRVAERCATGDGCPHLTTEHGHSVSRRDSIHGDKDRHLSCACATLRLEQMPDIILFRDCTLLSFLFLPFSCFPKFFIMMPFSKVRHFWFQCRPVAFLYIGEAIFIWCVPEPCGFLLELLAKMNVWQRDIRVDPEKSPLCE